ncbi:DUF4129 domain-containing protein [Natronomonas halophila]|uniref:DUF4129 domain-containing protein n=1 Tax=Natronomonas halophila TaxID=2747817 RepID=UPI0015B77DAA|nr:DUF4129 domain-containing protein [Natronomonas halophila]QLD86859.1 DUF4129 domain-containing protein [Natronomonas halophila]
MSGREPFRALVTVLAVVALVFAAGLLPAFGGAAPASQIAAELPGSGGGDMPSQQPQQQPAPQQQGSGSGSGISLSGGPGFDLSGLEGWRPPSNGGLLNGLLDLFSFMGGGSGGQTAPTGDGSDPSQQQQSGSGSDSDQQTATDGEGGQQSDPTDSERCRPANDPYVICFGEQLVPGTTTTLLVLDDNGDPVSGVGVRVNGEPAGTTNAEGLVEVEVPYAEQMVVSVESSNVAATGAYYSVSAAQDGASMSVESEVTIEFASDPGPGEEVSLRATVSDRPLPDATVLIDGEERTRTNDDGVATVTMPTATETQVAVTRGDLEGQRSLTLAAPRIALEGSGPLGIALPGQAATVVVTESGDPVADAEVRLGGESIGTTDDQGRVNATLPTAPTAALGATFPSGITHERTAYIGLIPGVLGVLGLFIIAGLALIARRSNARGPRELGSAIVATAQGIARGVVDRVVGLAATVEAIGAALRDALESLWNALHSKDPIGALQALLDRFRARVRNAGTNTVERVTAIASRGSGDGETTPAATDDGPPIVERAWWSLVSLVGLRRVSRRTPGDVAREAKAAGLPDGPVDRLTEAFRAVKYGGRDPKKYADEASEAEAELDGGDAE